jgi:hypothetical protein
VWAANLLTAVPAQASRELAGDLLPSSRVSVLSLGRVTLPRLKDRFATVLSRPV